MLGVERARAAAVLVDAAEAGERCAAPSRTRGHSRARADQRAVVEADRREWACRSCRRPRRGRGRASRRTFCALDDGAGAHRLGAHADVGHAVDCIMQFAQLPEQQSSPRGRWYLKLREKMRCPAAKSAEPIVSPSYARDRPARRT